MFRDARIKLTAWYLIIITVISISFSLAMYRVISSELDRLEQTQEFRLQRRLMDQFGAPPPPFYFDREVFADAKRHLILILSLVDLGILAASAAAGYFLAGRTLRPIHDMMEEQNRFITDSSHQLRTPLTSLKSEIEVNLRDKKLNLAGARQLLKSNLEEVNNLQTLSDYLIKLTQYQTTGSGLPIDRLSAAAVTDEAVKKVTSLAQIKQITLTSHVDDHELEGNQTALVEMLVIFLDNAIKYSPSGSEITLTGRLADHHYVYSISDHGLGIDESDLPHLFDRFFRGAKSRNKSSEPGYGLGLSIAKQIIDHHHGLIKVKSHPGDGTTFVVQLPLKH